MRRKTLFPNQSKLTITTVVPRMILVDPPLLRWGTTHPTRGIQLTLNGKKYVNGYDGGTDNSYDSDAKKKFRHHQQQQQQQQQQ